eukprot:s4377_g1.t1
MWMGRVFLLLQIVQSLLVGASRPFVLCTSECFDSKVAQDLIVGQLAMCNLLAQSNVRALACRNFIVGSRLQLPIRYSTHPFVPELRSRRHLGCSHGGLETTRLVADDMATAAAAGELQDTLMCPGEREVL